MQHAIDPHATTTTRQRYDRIAPVYDRMEQRAEARFSPWRAMLWQRVQGPSVLEIGVGTGKNMPYYPANMSITAIDLSPRMLAQARRRARQLATPVQLQEADAQALPFADAGFDTVVGTFIFCSVPDPLLGLQELRRVLVPGGQLLLLEHIRSSYPLVRQLMHLINPLVVRMTGANINRATITNVERAGFVAVEREPLWLDIVYAIRAHAPVA